MAVLPVRKPRPWWQKGRVTRKQLAKRYRAMRKRAAKYLFRAEAREIMALGASMGIEAKEVGAYLDRLWQKEGVTRKEVGTTARQQLHALAEWARSESAAKYRSENVRPEIITRDFGTFMKGKSIEEALQAMQDSMREQGAMRAAA